MSNQSFRVLVLEDDRELREVLQSLLSDEGYQVSVAESGEQAVELARDSRFDVIVADIRMPGMDGLDTVQHLRGHDPQLQSLVMTGYASEEDPIRALHIGVQSYLLKPFSLDDFLVRVRELAQKNLAAREQQAALVKVGGSLQWALRQTLAEGVRAGPRTIVDLLNLVQQMARGVGLRSRENYPPWLECAALVACLRRFGLSGTRVTDEPVWPDPVEEILGSLEERWDGQGVPEGLAGESIPISGRLISLALHLWQNGYLPGDPKLAQVEAADPGRYDPNLVRFMASPAARPTQAQEGTSAARLLSLAGILLEKGSYRQLRELYSEILAGQCLASQRVEALLGLTQVALGEGLVSEAMMHARHLMQASEGVGPLTRARGCLRLGLAFCARGLEAGVDAISQSLAQFQAARFQAGVVEASLALAHFDNRLLELPTNWLADFLRAQNLPAWIRANPWSIPCLLDRCSEENLVRAVIRAVQRDIPEYLQRLKTSTSLSDIGLRRLNDLLQGLPQEPADPTGSLQVFSLGSFELFHRGKRLDERTWATQKIKYLAARLFQESGRPVSEDVLIEDFWEGEAEKGKRNLSWSLTQLRRLLRDLVGDEITVSRRGNAVVLTYAQAPWHDLAQLLQCLEQAESAPIQPELCSKILTLYRGSYLPEHYADWAVSFRERLESRVCTLLTDALQKVDSLPASVRLEIAHRLLEIDACHQPAALELMTQAVQQGRPEEAVRVFKRISTRLHSDLGIEPDIRLLEVYYRADLGLTS
ncbi:response regulator [bacterium]|nr:response regulator [bacterium]